MPEKKEVRGDGGMDSVAISAEELVEFLPRKGAVELLCEIDSGGSRFSELEQTLDISSTTLSKRLSEGQDISLIEMKPKRGEQRAHHIYQFTEPGVVLQYYMMGSGVIGAYQMLRQAQETFEAKTEEMCEWTVDNGDILAEDVEGIMHYVGDLRHRVEK